MLDPLWKQFLDQYEPPSLSDINAKEALKAFEKWLIDRGNLVEEDPLQWIRDLADENKGQDISLDELRERLGKQLKEPLSHTILEERYGEKDRLTCAICKKDLDDMRLVPVVVHMIREHEATIEKLPMMRVGFGEEPEFDENGRQISFPLQLFIMQYAQRAGGDLTQAYHNARQIIAIDEMLPILTDKQYDDLCKELDNAQVKHERLAAAAFEFIGEYARGEIGDITSILEKMTKKLREAKKTSEKD